MYFTHHMCSWLSAIGEQKKIDIKRPRRCYSPPPSTSNMLNASLRSSTSSWLSPCDIVQYYLWFVSSWFYRLIVVAMEMLESSLLLSGRSFGSPEPFSCLIGLARLDEELGADRVSTYQSKDRIEVINKLPAAIVYFSTNYSEALSRQVSCQLGFTNTCSLER